MSDHTAFATYPSLRGAVAFVSGGASGLGAEFVAQLAGQGTVVGFVDIQEEAGHELVRAVASRGWPKPLFQPCDVCDIAALREAITRTADELGPVTVLVNNAANDQRQAVAELTEQEWDAGIAVNVRHHFFAAQAVAPMMRHAGGGSIINVGSISAHIDLTDLPVYITAKAGIEGLTRTLARELGSDGIRVNCVLPGWVMTERGGHGTPDPPDTDKAVTAMIAVTAPDVDEAQSPTGLGRASNLSTPQPEDPSEPIHPQRWRCTTREKPRLCIMPHRRR
jgi:NAD(P)-dependent dehydrogenase (short-subunit alcohol dehydrogenase family)